MRSFGSTLRHRDMRRRLQRGQIVPIFAGAIMVFVLLILLGILEFGFAFDQTMTITYATREGARNGSAFANGNASTMPCTTSADVDKYIVAAVQRILEGPGSRFNAARVSEIRIYKADTNGDQIGGQAKSNHRRSAIRHRHLRRCSRDRRD